MKTAQQPHREVILTGDPITFSQWDGSALRGMPLNNNQNLPPAAPRQRLVSTNDVAEIKLPNSAAP